MTFSERLEGLIEKNKTTQKAIAEYAGVRYASITDWKNKGFPRADVAVKIAEFLGTTVEYLITGKDIGGLSQEERDLIAKYKSLSGENRRSVRVLIDSMLPVPVEGKKEDGALSKTGA